MAPFSSGFSAADDWSSYGPSEKAPASGIYRCEHCDREVTVLRNHNLPPATDHQHAGPLGIRWRLVIKQSIH